MKREFRTRVSGKWVLAGEHSVLRGATAIALPHPDFGLSLRFEPDPSAEGLLIQPITATQVIEDLLNTIRDEWESEGRSFPWDQWLQGVLKIDSSIPIGAGFGSSAGLCVAMGRWLAPYLKVSEEGILAFATRLEHRFHGRSSGMDTAVIVAGEPITFAMSGGARPLGVRKLPRFTFHDTLVRASTQSCVAQVEEFRQKDPVLGMRIDGLMSLASRAAMEGLIRYDSGSESEGLDILKNAVKQAQECFYTWGLVPREAGSLEASLLKQGALAVKMTGAGGGGMMVALWPNASPNS